MKKIDLYNFQQASPRGQPGLEVFKGARDGLFYFHYNDRNGRPIVFSKGYESATKRDKAVDSILENGAQEARYKITAEAGGYFFVVRAGNNREIARSKKYSARKDAENVAKALRQNLQEKLEKKRLESGEITARSPVTESKKTEHPARFSFQLTFYPTVEGRQLRGRIEYPLKKEHATFKGLDMTAISAFIKNHLPQEPIPTIPGVKLPKPIRFVEEGKIVNKKSFSRNAPLAIQLEVGKEAMKDHHPDRFSAAVYAKNLQRQSRVLVGEFGGELPTDGLLQVPVITDILEPDLYRISMIVQLETGSKVNFRVEGSELVQVY